MKIECSICGKFSDCYDASELAEIMIGDSEFFVCKDCLNGLESLIRKAWNSK